VIALSSVKSGPPTRPACWPVTTATVLGSSRRSAAARAAGGADRWACCRRSASTRAARSREWARVLQHSLKDYLDRTPFWRAKQPPGRPDATEVPVKDHFDALRLVNAGMTGVWLVDGDGKRNVPPSQNAERAKLNRVIWTRYETESFLVHPAALARFIDSQVGMGGSDAVRAFLRREFEKYAGAGLGVPIADAFIANPAQPSQIVERYLGETKARTQVVGGILEEGGVHGMDYTQFSQIAAVMTPGEVHPEIIEKLNFIQQAFGL